MDYFELVEISTRHLELTNPAATDKLWTIGQYLDLNAEKRIIDFGCGYSRTLALWAKNLGIHGLGIEIHSFLCRQAQKRILNAGLHGQAEIIQANPSMYLFDPNMYDIASCLGASFVWGGFQQALQGMKKSLKTKGKIIVGEPYYIQENVPESLIKFEGDLHTEYRLIQISRNEGFDVEFVIRASRDD